MRLQIPLSGTMSETTVPSLASILTPFMGSILCSPLWATQNCGISVHRGVLVWKIRRVPMKHFLRNGITCTRISSLSHHSLYTCCVPGATLDMGRSALVGNETGGRDRHVSRQLFWCVLSAVMGKIGCYGNILEAHVNPGIWGVGEVFWRSNSEAEPK